MANHMAEVAKMLGVELGEKFELKSIPGIPFKFTEDGLVCLGPAKIPRDVMNEAFIHILTDCSNIKRKPWKPNDGERYWYVDERGRIWSDYFDYYSCTSHCMNYYKIGNCYRTREEAEANRDKWAAFYASDEVLEV